MKVCEEKLNDFLEMIYGLYHSVKKENNELKAKIKYYEMLFTFYDQSQDLELSEWRQQIHRQPPQQRKL